MRRMTLMLLALSLALWAAPAFAQSGSANNSSSSGGGTAVSGNNRSSVSIHTSGGSSVGVAQGSVSGGSRASGTNGDGDQAGAASSGGGVGGQSAGVVAPANAVEDGVVSQIGLPALDLGESTSAADRRPDFLTWAIAAMIIVGLVVLYRRLPRSTPAA